MLLAVAGQEKGCPSLMRQTLASALMGSCPSPNQWLGLVTKSHLRLPFVHFANRIFKGVWLVGVVCDEFEGKGFTHI